MANSSEFIEILSPSALADLQKANAEVVTLISNIDKVGAKMKGATTPSGSDSAIKSLTTAYNEQAKAIEKLQNKTIEAVALEKEKLRVENELAKVGAKIKLANDQNTISLNTQKSVLKSLNGAYAELSEKVKRASDNYQNIIVRGKTAEQTQRQYNKELKQAKTEFQNLQSKILEADKAVGKWNRTGERSIGFVKNLIGAFGIVGGVTLFASISKDIFDTTKELQSLDNALKQVTGTQQIFSEQQQFLKRISEDYGVELKGLTKQYTQFYVSAKDKLASSQIQQIFESITKAGASMGLSVESQERAFLALNQMMSKGTIQAEELRGQLGEALPGAFSIMAKAVGVSESALADMMKKGEVLAKDVLPKFAKELEKAYGIENKNNIDSITASQNRLTNAWTEFVRELSGGDSVLKKLLTGTMSALKGVIEGITYAIESNASERQRILKAVQESGYKDYKDLAKKMSDEDLASQKKYNSDQINENKSKVEAMIAQNKLIYKSNFSSGIGITDKAKKDYETWKKNQIEINKLNEFSMRLIGENRAFVEAENERIATSNTKKHVKTKAELKEEERLRKELIKRLEEEAKIRYELSIAIAERQLGFIKSDLDNEKLYINDRLELLDKLAIKETEISLKKYQENIRLHKDSNDQMQIDAIEFQNQIDKINKNRVDAGLEELSRYYKEFEDYQNKYDGEGLKFDIFGENPEEGFKKWQEGSSKSKDEIEKLKKSTKEWIDGFSESFMGERGFNTLFDVLSNKIVGFGDDFKTTFLAITEIAQETLNYITELSNQRFENEKANLQNEKDIALAFAGDNADARLEIERQYQQRQKEIKRREFQAKKEQALFNIVIDTAQGVMGAYAEQNYGMAVAIAALGIIEAGIVASQQMPEFWKGTDNAPEGWAFTQEKGREIITDKNGKVKSLGNDKGATPTYLNKGDKVYTAEQSALMFDNNLNSILANNGISTPKIEVNNTIDFSEVVSAIENKEGFELNIDERGFQKLIRNGSSVRELMNKKVRYVGKSV